MAAETLLQPRKTLAGEVEHFYPRIFVAVVKASTYLKIGDRIAVETRDGPFEQEVGSMEIAHKPVSRVKPGDSFGLKMARRVQEGDRIFIREELAEEPPARAPEPAYAGPPLWPLIPSMGLL